MTATRHPAKFTDVILEEALHMLRQQTCVECGLHTMYDPFAGVGKGVQFMYDHGVIAWGTELEPEWAEQCPYVTQADSLAYMQAWADNKTDYIGVEFVFTSPVYGNRMADHHEARDSSRRNTYRHALGRPLSEGSSAGLQWGDAYREFHTRAWGLVFQVLKPGGHFLLNVKDHIRNGEQVHVSLWHHETVLSLGFESVGSRYVTTPGNRQGANGNARVDGEWLGLYRKPEA